MNVRSSPPRRPRRRQLRPLTLTAAFAVAAAMCLAAVPADAGVGEIALDADAVRQLMRAQPIETIEVDAGFLGVLRIAISPPKRVAFRDGRIEALADVRIAPIELEGVLAARYVPSTRESDGTVLLAPESVRLTGDAELPLDLATLLPPVELPRELGWPLEPIAGAPPQWLLVHPQRVRVTEDRLVFSFGIAVRGAPEPTSGP